MVPSFSVAFSSVTLDVQGFRPTSSIGQLQRPHMPPPSGHSHALARSLLRTGDDYAGAVGASRAQYRLLAGTWLNFQSSAGAPDGAPLCAKSNMAAACSHHAAATDSARAWPDDRRRVYQH